MMGWTGEIIVSVNVAELMKDSNGLRSWISDKSTIISYLFVDEREACMDKRRNIEGT